MSELNFKNQAELHVVQARMSRIHFSSIIAFIFFIQLSSSNAEENNIFIFDYMEILPECSSNLIMKVGSTLDKEPSVNVELSRRNKTTLKFTFNNNDGSPDVHIDGLLPASDAIGPFPSLKVCGNSSLSVVSINNGVEKEFSYPSIFKYLGIDAVGENVYFEYAGGLLLKYEMSKDLITEIFLKKGKKQTINSLVKSKEGYYGRYEYKMDGKLFITGIDYDYYKRLTITDQESGKLLMDDLGGALIPVGKHELYYCAPCCWESNESLYFILNSETLKKSKIQKLPCPRKTGTLKPHPKARHYIYLGWSIM